MFATRVVTMNKKISFRSFQPKVGLGHSIELRRATPWSTYMFAAFLGVASGYYTFQPELHEYWTERHEEKEEGNERKS